MIDFNSIKTEHSRGRSYRKAYHEGVVRLIDRKTEEARQTRDRDFSPAAVARDREAFRKKYVDMLGWPLNEYTPGTSPNAKKELIEETADLNIYRLCSGIVTVPSL